MIEMPRRSVTRFFIPLIDVLILLFCIFLLMEFESGSKADAEGERAEDLSTDNVKVNDELARRLAELRDIEALRDQVAELQRLRKRVAELENVNQKDFHDEWDMRMIEIERDGSLSFDPKKPKTPIINFRDEETARKLIEQHKEEVKGRKVLYVFQFPRGNVAPKLSVQERGNYREWFRGDGFENTLPPFEKKKKDKK